MFVGGLGLCETMHVRLIVEPVSMNISGEPINVVIGSGDGRVGRAAGRRRRKLDGKFSLSSTAR
jgi:hypothetical protein